MSSTDKSTKKKHADQEQIDDIMDSDELFDLDMPLDEPENELEDTLEQPADGTQTNAAESETADLSDSLQNLMDEYPASDPQDSESNQAEEEQETLLTVEQDLEHLLDRGHSDSEKEFDQVPPPANTGSQAESMGASALPETEPIAAMPSAEKTDTKPRSGIASSFMLTLGLIAILIASLATWLGMEVAQQKTNLALASSNLQQQIKLLTQQQQQQKLLLTQDLDALEKRLNTLTQVVAHKTAEQWRSSLRQKTTVGAEKTTAASPASSPKPEAAVQQAKVETKTRPKAIVQPVRPARHSPAAEQSVKKTVPKSAKKTSLRPTSDLTQLSRYEVAPGTVKGWVVNIFSVASRSTAERQIRRLKTKDIQAEYVRVQVKGKIWYRVRSSGFKNERSAIAFKKLLKEYHGIDAWHSYLK